ncbi:MAG TPA: molybdopterin cofactor-binding domain-containing protein [Actinocrinis sp.]|uniref:xanthine dehydrogenase family protein molybdopterin-binding subunit n=1 Tax=Actinocrinis sp. TaxID=1920516 RepID=UPI002D4439B1|nr:molybdopterin cofactor-binding domain-containing protein [Actinocrinis sp.]HZU56864.1 molybdopterin cofactor-binding domain-containing protein [Actinocrinis sp.]
MNGNGRRQRPGGVGDSPLRPDAAAKVLGAFEYASDLKAEGMLYGATLRSPHPSALIKRIDTAPALAMPGVRAVLTHEDVPGRKFYGLIVQDCPVLAIDQVRYHGEPVAIVAADDAETAHRAASAIVVEYAILPAVTDLRSALFDSDSPRVHPGGNLVRHQPIRRGNPADPAVRAMADVEITREYQVGMQDQAFLGPEAGLAYPTADGGIELHVATQWLHADLEQIAPCLGLPESKVHMTLAGVGGAFGGREDLSVQIHAAMLARRTGKPVRMVYNRQESFFGHVHRHPAIMRYTHGARRDGTLVYVVAEILLDGGAYASTTEAVVGNASSLGAGPYEVDHVAIDAYGAYTNNPPCGAMRGFGAVQACFAYESQMDALAAALGMHPLDLRARNAVKQGSTIATGQVIDSPAPLAEMFEQLRAMPMPQAPDRNALLPGGYGNTTHGEGVRRGVGYGVGIKNICYSEGFDDYATARVTLTLERGEPVASVHTAAAEVGQGLVTVQGQIARTELGVEQVKVERADTRVGSSGSSSASRQSYMTGGAVKAACEAVRDRVFQTARELGVDVPQGSALIGGKIVSMLGEPVADLADLLGDGTIEETREYRHRPTGPLDRLTGQGSSHVQFAFAVHRAVVDVDVELGLIRVVQLDVVQDVGRIINRLALEGQIQGGTAQGLGLAVLEEIVTDGGKVLNPSFTDYLIPTILDMPPLGMRILEHPDPASPYGLRGAGEPPTLSSTPAIAAAVRDATGLALTRVPIRPEHIALREPQEQEANAHA